MNKATTPNDPGAGDWRGAFQVRAGLVIMLVVFWALVAGAKLLHMTIYQRGRTLLTAEKRVWRTGVLPAARGRLLDRNGIPIAWTEREFCLEYRKASTGEEIWQDMHSLSDCLGLESGELRLRVNEVGGDRVILKSALVPEEILKLSVLLGPGSRWRVISRFVRRYRNLDTQILKQIGVTRQFGQKQVGLSGWEAEHNEKLGGLDGKYRVMVDEKGEWILDTWEEVRKPRPGYDVYLPISARSGPGE